MENSPYLCTRFRRETLLQDWKGAGVVDRGGLENRCTLCVPWVRIPPFPQKTGYLFGYQTNNPIIINLLGRFSDENYFFRETSYFFPSSGYNSIV